MLGLVDAAPLRQPEEAVNQIDTGLE